MKEKTYEIINGAVEIDGISHKIDAKKYSIEQSFIFDMDKKTVLAGKIRTTNHYKNDNKDIIRFIESIFDFAGMPLDEFLKNFWHGFKVRQGKNVRESHNCNTNYIAEIFNYDKWLGTKQAVSEKLTEIEEKFKIFYCEKAGITPEDLDQDDIFIIKSNDPMQILEAALSRAARFANLESPNLTVDTALDDSINENEDIKDSGDIDDNDTDDIDIDENDKGLYGEDELRDKTAKTLKEIAKNLNIRFAGKPNKDQLIATLTDKPRI